MTLVFLTIAHADPLAAAMGPPLPYDQRCLVDIGVRDDTTMSAWRVATFGKDTLAVTMGLPPGKRQAVLQTGGATWYQTEGMRAPMRVGLAQRVFGQFAIADVVDPRQISGWLVEPPGADGVLHATARPDAGLAYARAEFALSDGRLTTARFSGPSGAVTRTAHYRYTAGELTEVHISDASRPTRPTVLSLGKPVCSDVLWFVTAETLLIHALALAP